MCTSTVLYSFYNDNKNINFLYFYLHNSIIIFIFAQKTKLIY
jgi:hypothetical protein